jgi:hypothetical protein
VLPVVAFQVVMALNTISVKANGAIAVEDAGGISLLITVYHVSKILIVLFA